MPLELGVEVSLHGGRQPRSRDGELLRESERAQSARENTDSGQHLRQTDTREEKGKVIFFQIDLPSKGWPWANRLTLLD